MPAPIGMILKSMNVVGVASLILHPPPLLARRSAHLQSQLLGIVGIRRNADGWSFVSRMAIRPLGATVLHGMSKPANGNAGEEVPAPS